MSRLGAPRRLITDRLLLVATDRTHAPGLTRAILSSLDELRPWMSWAAAPSLEQTRAFTLGAEDRWATSTGWIFTIVHKGEPIGTLGLDQFEAMLERAEMGYWIKTEFAGQGLMKEAGRALIAFAFDHIGLHRIELHSSPDNIASIKVAEGLCFRREGLARDMARNPDGFYDCVTFGLLKTDPR